MIVLGAKCDTISLEQEDWDTDPLDDFIVWHDGDSISLDPIKLTSSCYDPTQITF